MTSNLLNNRYRIVKPLGEGGFGNTFLAEDTHMPSGRRCVIKQLKPVTNDPQYYQLVKDRFQREAATLEKLGQGNNQIPNLYAYFSEADQFYLVQEWIEGETLTKLVEQQGKLAENQVKGVLASLLPVLAYIHSNRIVHRDIKPDNIIIRSVDNQPVLIDFGAVKEAMGTVVNSQGNATNSIVIGTPGFMASEQAAGRPVYASDLYGLGLVGIYCLTGKMPQELVNDPQTDELLWQQYAPQVSPQLATVLNKGIMSHPRDRFNDAHQMLAALQSNLDNAPTVAVAPGNSYPVSQAEFSPTVAVAAPASQTVTVPNRKSGLAGSIIIGSIIMAGIIGGAVMLGLRLNNTADTTSQETASTTTTDSSESSSSAPIDSQTEPTQTQNNAPVREEVANQEENSSPPVESNNSPVTEKSQPDRQEVSRPSPEQTVLDYYSNLNNGKLQAAWEQLPEELQNNPRVHPRGYVSYATWFSTVDFVDVQQIKVAEEKEETAKVDVRFKYNMNNGKVSSHNLRYFLIWNPETKSWQFAQITNR